MWIYEQTSGKMYRPDGRLLATGYAGGNCGENPEGINNHAMQHCRSIGPIPVGMYTIGSLIDRHRHLGPFVIVLEPYENNEMFGRSAFRIHGDTTPPGNASEGCIILPRAARLEIAESTDRLLKVVAERN